MNRSLRWRLQGWYAVVLLAVVGGFATLLYAQMRSARFQEIDAALTADATTNRRPRRLTGRPIGRRRTARSTDRGATGPVRRRQTANGSSRT
jgi:hypothetical protein